MEKVEVGSSQVNQAGSAKPAAAKRRVARPEPADEFESLDA